MSYHIGMARLRTHKYKPEHAIKAGKLYGMGCTFKMIAASLDIPETTLHEWRKTYPAINIEMEKQRTRTNVRVSTALYDQAIGYEYEVEETHKLKHVDENGNNCERVEVVKVKKFKEGVTSAAIHWLKCRQPESWSETHKVEVSNLEDLLGKIMDTSRGLPSADTPQEEQQIH